MLSNLADPSTAHSLRQLLRSANARVVAVIVSAVFIYLLTRETIQNAGLVAFGYASVISSLPALFPTYDLGAGAAVTNAVASRQPGYDDSQVHASLLRANRLTLFVGLVLVAAAAVLFLTGAWSHLLGGASSSVPSLDAGASTALAMMGLTAPLSIGQSVLVGAGRNQDVIKCQMLGSPLAFLVTYLFGVLRVPGGWYALPIPLAIFLVVASTWLVAKVRVGSVVGTAFVHAFRPSERHEVVEKVAVPALVISIGLPLSLQSDRVILGNVAPPHELAAYAATLPLFAACFGVIANSGVTLWSAFAGMRSRGESPHALWTRALALLTGLSVAGATLLVLAGPPVIDAMTRGRVAASWVLVGSFAALLVVHGFHLASGMLLTDAIGLRAQALGTTLMFLLNVPLSIVLAATLGAPGPIISSALTLFVCLLVPSYVIVRRRLRNGDDVVAGTQLLRDDETQH